MAANLHAAGMVLRLWNRTRSKADAFASSKPGTTVFDTPSDAATGADAVVSMVADDEAAWTVHTGSHGVLGADPLPSVVLECGTISPAAAQALAAEAAKRGVLFLDAPVSGSIDAAKRGALLFMIGGAAEGVQRAQPLLAALGSDHVHFGESGQGAMVKLLVNGVLHAYGGAVSESLTVAKQAGLDVGDVYHLLARSAAGAPMLQYREPQYLTPDAPVTFTIDLAHKDVALLRDEAQKLGVPTTHLDAHQQALGAAKNAGYGPRDMADLWRYLSEQEGEP